VKISSRITPMVLDKAQISIANSLVPAQHASTKLRILSLGQKTPKLVRAYLGMREEELKRFVFDIANLPTAVFDSFSGDQLRLLVLNFLSFGWSCRVARQPTYQDLSHREYNDMCRKVPLKKAAQFGWQPIPKAPFAEGCDPALLSFHQKTTPSTTFEKQDLSGAELKAWLVELGAVDCMIESLRVGVQFPNGLISRAPHQAVIRKDRNGEWWLFNPKEEVATPVNFDYFWAGHFLFKAFVKRNSKGTCCGQSKE